MSEGEKGRKRRSVRAQSTYVLRFTSFTASSTINSQCTSFCMWLWILSSLPATLRTSSRRIDLSSAESAGAAVKLLSDATEDMEHMLDAEERVGRQGGDRSRGGQVKMS